MKNNMQITKKTSMEGNWIKVGDTLKDGDSIKIGDAGSVVNGDYGDRHVFKIKVKGQEGEFIMSFNQTSLNAIVDAHGDESENWVNKILKVHILKQMVGDKMRNVAYLAPEGWDMTEDGLRKIGEDYPTPESEGGTEINPEDIPF